LEFLEFCTVRCIRPVIHPIGISCISGKRHGRVEQHPPADNRIPDSNKFRKQHFPFEKMHFFIAHGEIFVI